MKGDESVKQLISSETVATKLNDWYAFIRKNQVSKAQHIKTQIETELDLMEEDQNVLLYYSLLDFRHQLMLSYVKPHLATDINGSLALIEEKKEVIVNHQLGDIIQYYFWFFKGMYEFRRNNFPTAISFYKKAEKKITMVVDDVEKAEFYYKLSEIYYHMKQNYYSMHYAHLASNIFSTYKGLEEKKIYCDFIIAGNLKDGLKYDEALEKYTHALFAASKTNNKNLIASACYNVGICHFYRHELNEAAKYMEEALDIFGQETSSYIPKVLYTLMFIKIKQRNNEEASVLYKQGMRAAHSLNNEEYIAKLTILNELYLEDGNNEIIELEFDYLESKNLYEAVEELSFEAAKYYSENRLFEESVYYFNKNIKARQKIQKGEEMHEN